MTPSTLDLIFAGHEPLRFSDAFVPDNALDVDFDQPGKDLGDNPDTMRGVAGQPLAFAAQAPMVAETTKPVPFDRVLSFHQFRQMQGRDVLAVQRALGFAHLRFHEPTMSYGWLVRDEVKLLQRRFGLPVDGVYGPETHRRLVPWFDGYCRWLYTHAQDAPPPIGTTANERRVRAAWYLYAHRPMAYHAVRPFLLYGYGDRIGYTFDCSWLYTEASYLARTPDPNGFNYNGWGNTESLKEHGSVVGVAQPGDAIHYGYYGSGADPAHVAIAVAKGACIGLGGPGGPRYLPSDYRTIREVRRYP